MPGFSIEEIIRRAMEEGKFDNLPGKGKPLRLEENPHEDPAWRTANQVLHNAGFTLPWIENIKEIEKALEEARAALERSWAWRQAALEEGSNFTWVEAEWQRAVSGFRQKIAALNKRIHAVNLEVPVERFQVSPLDAEREIGRITVSPAPD